MITDSKVGSHSATVELALHVAGRSVSLAQVGPDFVVLREPEHFPCGVATVVATIDGFPRQWEVVLRTQSPDNLAMLPIVSVDE